MYLLRLSHRCSAKRLRRRHAASQRLAVAQLLHGAKAAADAAAKVAAAAGTRPSGFTAYGITQEDDPISQAMRSLAEGTATHDQQLQLLWQAVEKLSAKLNADCLPCESERTSHFEKDRIDQILGK